jgi:hypothetical protein
MMQVSQNCVTVSDGKSAERVKAARFGGLLDDDD